MSYYTKCLICNRDADPKAKDYLAGFCSKCIEQFYQSTNSKAQKNRQVIYNDFEFYQKDADDVFQALKKNKTSDMVHQTSIPKKEIQNTIHKPSNTQKVQGTAQKSALTFKGEVRPLNENEQKQNSKLSCSYCKLSIDRKLYFHPLVILKCGDGLFHRKCFAKYMAEGNTDCPNCHKHFFTKYGNQNDTDDSDEGDNFF